MTWSFTNTGGLEYSPTGAANVALYLLLVAGFVVVIGWMVVERARHQRNLDAIGLRVVVNGIRGKSSISRLIAGALRGSTHVVAAKTTGTAARFIYPGGREVPIKRVNKVVNVIEQVGVVERAANLRATALVAECMAVQPQLQELNQDVLIRANLVVISNVRADHLEEMGPTLEDVARSLSRSMPRRGICVTAERKLFHILEEEAHARRTALYYADPDDVTDEEMAPFTWITFKENVSIALMVAQLCGVDRKTALMGMYAAAPDPGALRIDVFKRHGRAYQAVNLFAANDPDSTLMNLNLLRERGLIQSRMVLVINCRDDRVERNGQMGAIVATINPDRVVIIGSSTKAAHSAVAPSHLDRTEVVEGDCDGELILDLITRDCSDQVTSVVMIGNIHGMGEVLLEALRGEEAPFPQMRSLASTAKRQKRPFAGGLVPSQVTAAQAFSDVSGDSHHRRPEVFAKGRRQKSLSLIRHDGTKATREEKDFWGQDESFPQVRSLARARRRRRSLSMVRHDGTKMTREADERNTA
jgi:poly-gamma-glutamate synthase PgsB/CapB